MGKPCDVADMELFYAYTSITIGYAAKAPFWGVPWMDGRRPKGIARLVHEACKRKKWAVRHALADNEWTKKFKLNGDFFMDHLFE